MPKTENQRHVLTETELKRLQGIELELLVEFDRICRKHGIIYSIDGGTLLGAVRHGDLSHGMMMQMLSWFALNMRNSGQL